MEKDFILIIKKWRINIWAIVSGYEHMENKHIGYCEWLRACRVGKIAPKILTLLTYLRHHISDEGFYDGLLVMPA